jgi:hypothetical protein
MDSTDKITAARKRYDQLLAGLLQPEELTPTLDELIADCLAAAEQYRESHPFKELHELRLALLLTELAEARPTSDERMSTFMHRALFQYAISYHRKEIGELSQDEGFARMLGAEQSVLHCARREVRETVRYGRAFLRTSPTSDDRDAKGFGGFVLSSIVDPAEDAVYEIEIAFVKKLAEGPACHGRNIDQVMTGPVLGNPKLLEVE